MRTLILLPLAFLFLGVSCRKATEPVPERNVLYPLYEQYKQGEIEKCHYNGQIVYSCALNAYDAGSAIYDAEGNKIATCNFAWGRPDSMCSQLTDCETLYRVEPNIWGRPGVNKLGF